MLRVPAHKSGSAGQIVNPVPAPASRDEDPMPSGHRDITDADPGPASRKPAQTLADYVGHVHAHESELRSAAPLGSCCTAGEYSKPLARMVVDALFGDSWVQVVPTDGRPAEFCSYDDAHAFAMQLCDVSGMAFKIRFVP